MTLTLRTFLSRWRYRQMMRPFDREIAKARKAHKRVRPIMEAKTAFLHAALRGEAA